MTPEKQILLLDTHIKEHELSLVRLRSEREDAKAMQQLPCKSCGAIHEIGELQYVQVVYYEEPFSCTGGDYHYSGKGSIFICLACGVYNHLWFDKPQGVPYDVQGDYVNDVEYQFQRNYKNLFKEVVEVHDKERRDSGWGGLNYKWAHNNYVNEHMEDFQLRVEYNENLVSE